MPKIREFDHFEVITKADGSLEELGRGAMGVTYKVFDKNLLSVAVVKVLHPAQASIPAIRKQFLEEAQLMASLRHPSIPQVYHLGQTETWPFYAMEYCDGPSLQHYVSKVGRMPADHVFQLAKQMASALAALEKTGLVHRDIKPANLVLTPESTEATRIKLIDFGLVIKTHQSRPDEKTFVGTPMFASPEQFVLRPALDVRSDIYSLGLTLWFMLSGQLPYKGNLTAIMTSQTHDMPSFERLPKMTEAQTALLWKMLQKRKEDRHQSAAELEAELRHCLQHTSQDLFLQLGNLTKDRNAPQVPITVHSPYKLLRPESEEKFGRRFLARAAHTDADVSLVLLHPKWGQDKNVLEGLRDTRLKMRQHPHPHWLPIVGESRVHGRSAYAIERGSSEAKSLLSWMQCNAAKTSQPPPPDLTQRVVAVLMQLADAFDTARKIGLYWVPVSPDRIFITESENAEPFLRLETFDPMAAMEQEPTQVGQNTAVYQSIAQPLCTLLSEPHATSIQTKLHELPSQIPAQQSLRELVSDLLHSHDQQIPSAFTSIPRWAMDSAAAATSWTATHLPNPGEFSHLGLHAGPLITEPPSEGSIPLLDPSQKQDSAGTEDPITDNATGRGELIQRLEQQRRTLQQEESTPHLTYQPGINSEAWNLERDRYVLKRRSLVVMSGELEAQKQQHALLHAKLLELAQKNFLRHENQKRNDSPENRLFDEQILQDENQLLALIRDLSLNQRAWKIRRLEWRLADHLESECRLIVTQQSSAQAADPQRYQDSPLANLQKQVQERVDLLERLLRSGLVEAEASTEQTMVVASMSGQTLVGSSFSSSTRSQAPPPLPTFSAATRSRKSLVRRELRRLFAKPLEPSLLATQTSHWDPAIQKDRDELIQFTARLESLFQQYYRRQQRLLRSRLQAWRNSKERSRELALSSLTAPLNFTASQQFRSQRQNLIEARLAAVEHRIEEFNDDLAQRAAEVLKFKHREQARREDHKLQAAAEVEMRRKELEELDARIAELKTLEKQDMARRKQRRLIWMGVIFSAMIVSLLVAKQVKVVERFILPDSVKGRKAWQRLVDDRQRSIQQKDWPQLLHQIIFINQQAALDLDLGRMVERHQSALFEDTQSALDGLLRLTERSTPKEMDQDQLIENLEVLVRDPRFSGPSNQLLARIQLRKKIQNQLWAETLQAYHLWKSRSNEAAASMLPEIREMLKNLWIVLPQQLDTLDVAFLLDALKELPDQDIHLIGSQGISTLMLAMQMELHKRQHHLLNSNAKALQVFLDMAAKSHSPAVWELGMDHRAWWDHYLKPWLYGQNMAQASILVEHPLWARIAAIVNQPEPLVAMANAVQMNDETGTKHLLDEPLRFSYLRQAAAIGSQEAKLELELIEKTQRARDAMITSEQLMAPSPPLEPLTPLHTGDERMLRLQSDRLLLTIQERYAKLDQPTLSPEQIKSQLDELQHLAIQLPVDDYRRAETLGVLHRHRAELTDSISEKNQLYLQASQHFQKAHELGNPRALWYAATTSYLAGDRVRYLQLLEKGVQLKEHNCVLAMAQEVISENEIKAVGLILLAADLGNPKAIEICKKQQDVYRSLGFSEQVNELLAKLNREVQTE